VGYQGVKYAQSTSFVITICQTNLMVNNCCGITVFSRSTV
jgi:hypothetical protein